MIYSTPAEKSLRIGTNLIVARSIFGELWNAYHLVCPDVQTKVSLEENEALLLKRKTLSSIL